MNFIPVNLNEIGTKAQSKGELYRLLTVEGGLYLPPQDQTNMDFISDICFGDKTALKSAEVKVCSVPHVKGLRCEDLIKFIVQDCGAEVYLPRKYENKTPNRTFLGNLCNTLDFEHFQEKIKTVLSEREEELLEKRNLSVRICPDIAAIFGDSKMVAVGKGKSHKLLRKNLLRKDKEAQIQKEEELKEAAERAEALKDEVERLKGQLDHQRLLLEERQEDSEILKDLFSKGIIDQEGNPMS